MTIVSVRVQMKEELPYPCLVVSLKSGLGNLSTGSGFEKFFSIFTQELRSGFFTQSGTQANRSGLLRPRYSGQTQGPDSGLKTGYFFDQVHT